MFTVKGAPRPRGRRRRALAAAVTSHPRWRSTLILTLTGLGLSTPLGPPFKGGTRARSPSPYIQTDLHTYGQTHRQTNRHACMDKHTSIRTYIHTYLHTYSRHAFLWASIATHILYTKETDINIHARNIETDNIS